MEDRLGILNKFWAKVLAVFLLCGLGAGIVWCGMGMAVGLSQSDYLEAESFYETAAVDSAMENTGRDILIMEMYNGTAIDQFKHSNFLYKAYKRNKYGRYAALDENYGDNSTAVIGTEKTLYYEVDKDTQEFFRMFAPVTNAEAADDHDYYRIDLKVIAPPVYRDRLYQVYQIYGMYKPVAGFLIPAATIMAVLFALVLLFAFCAAGHKEGVEGIHLLWIDSVPYEILVGAFGAGALACVAAAIEATDAMYDSYQLDYVLFILIALLMAAALLIYAVLMSSARRLKGHVFRQNSWICRLLAGIRTFLSHIPSVWQAALLIGGWLIIQFICFVYIWDAEARAILILVNSAMGILLVIFAMYCRELYIAGEKLASGEQDYRIDDNKLRLMWGPFREHAQNLNETGGGMQIALEKAIRSERMKTELITNVSHDIKTPLTSIVNYVDLLQKEHTEEQEKEYLEVLARQSERLKRLTEDLVEASKASTGNISADIHPVNVREILDQSAAEYQEKLDQGELTLVTNVPEEGLRVMADGRLLWRVMSNLFSNVIKYAMPATRVYLDAVREDSTVRITMKNISRDPLNISAEELTERFVRGDESRHTEGSGLGLNIAQSLAAIQKGRLEITVDGDLFRADILLPAANIE